MFVQHPLSGRADATDFHLDAGRLCVLLSGHRVACWILGVTASAASFAVTQQEATGASEFHTIRNSKVGTPI